MYVSWLSPGTVKVLRHSSTVLCFTSILLNLLNKIYLFLLKIQMENTLPVQYDGLDN